MKNEETEINVTYEGFSRYNLITNKQKPKKTLPKSFNIHGYGASS